MDENGISIRYDDGRKEFVVELNVKGLRLFEASGGQLSDAFVELAEALESEGL